MDETKNDGWQNIVSGLGRSMDKLVHNKPAYTPMSYEELHNFVLADSLIQTIVDTYVEESKAGDWQLPLDSEQAAASNSHARAGNVNGNVKGACSKKEKTLVSDALLKFLPSTLLEEILRICIIDGGCLLRLEAEGRYEEELNENMPITGITPISPAAVVLKNEYFEDNAHSSNYGKPRYYHIKKIFAEYGTYIIHHTRTIAIRKSSFLVSMKHLNQWWWGISRIEKLYPICSAVSHVPNVCYNLFNQYGQSEYTLSNIEQLVAAGDWKSLENRLEAIQLQKSVVHGVFLGTSEKVESKSPNVGGFDVLVELLFYLASSFSHIPQSKLFGRSQGGLTSSGTGDEKNLGKFLRGLRSSYLIPVLRDVGKRIAIQYKFSPDIMNEIVWEDDSSTELELVDIRFKQAQTDKTYFDMGVLDSDEIRMSRFVNGYSIETSVHGEAADDRFQDFAKTSEGTD